MKRIIIYTCLLIVTAVTLLFLENSTMISIVVGILVASITYLIDFLLGINLKIGLFYKLYSKEYVRISASYLFRIKVDDVYLLIRGNRIKDQFQPVGGVFKWYDSSEHIFRELKILDDEHMSIDQMSDHDLRILVPGRSVIRFLKWFEKKVERETTPEREFREELLDTKILNREKFNLLTYEYLFTHTSQLRYSNHFKCFEILLAEIYEFKPNNIQLLELRELMKNTNSADFKWVDASAIRKLGYDKENPTRISESSMWII